MHTSFRPLVIASFAAIGLFSCSTSDSNMNDSTQPEFNESQFSAAPVADKQEHITEIHGLELKDDYFWMRLSDAQKEAETPDAQTTAVVDYLNAENDYKTEVLKPTEHSKNPSLKKSLAASSKTTKAFRCWTTDTTTTPV